ncbi:regulatory protein RecX [Lysobacter terrae]
MERSDSERSHSEPQRPARKPRELSATQRALGLLTRREHSRKELTRKLTSRGMDAAEVESAVAKLAHDGWQNDIRFAESLVRARASGGYGPARIRAELSTHGLDREAIAAALDTFHGDWAEIASDLVRRRYGPVAALDLNQRRKAADFLLRRGFDAASARAAIRADFETD